MTRSQNTPGDSSGFDPRFPDVTSAAYSDPPEEALKPEHLPPGTSSHDLALDAVLTEWAAIRRAERRPGLESRILQASAGSLPAPLTSPIPFTRAVTVEAGERRSASPDDPRRRRAGHGWALRAASVAAVLTLAAVAWWSAWQARTPASPDSERRVAVEPPMRSGTPSPTITLATDVCWHAADEAHRLISEIAYIVESDRIRSPQDIDDELTSLFPELRPTPSRVSE